LERCNDREFHIAHDDGLRSHFEHVVTPHGQLPDSPSSRHDSDELQELVVEQDISTATKASTAKCDHALTNQRTTLSEPGLKADEICYR
jgi:hypothetical protein